MTKQRHPSQPIPKTEWERMSEAERDAARQRRSQAGRAFWDGLSDEEKASRLAKSRATFEASYPHRVRLHAEIKAQLASGALKTERCDRCGGEGRVMLNFDDDAQTVEVIGWRCYPCRKESPPA